MKMLIIEEEDQNQGDETYDLISSLKIPKGWKVEAYEYNIGEGIKQIFTSDISWVSNANVCISKVQL